MTDKRKPGAGKTTRDGMTAPTPTDIRAASAHERTRQCEKT